MKFNLRNILTAPAAILMMMSVGTGIANASGVTINNSNGNVNVTSAHSGNASAKSGKAANKAASPKAMKKAIQGAMAQTAKNAGGYGKNTTGGAKAAKKNVAIVHNVPQLRRVLKNAKGKPVAVIVKGNLDGNYDPKTKKTLTAKDYTKGTGYNFNQYLRDYNPKTYGKKEPAGKQENARKTAQKRQEKQITVNVPSNATIFGAPGSNIKNVNFKVAGSNDIIRNLNIQDPVDDFPSWDPKDGKSGNWNSQYDGISVRGGKNVWLDHDNFSDGNQQDAKPSKKMFNRQYQQHDGSVDITNGADKVTASNNKFSNHDKTMLIGNSDSRKSDAGKLNVSLLHNTFANNTQRMPRVRYGNVSVRHNYYYTNDKKPYNFGYMFEQGKHAKINADHNTLVDTKQPMVKKSSNKPSKANQKLANQAVSVKNADLTDKDSYTKAPNTLINGQNYNVKINKKANVTPTAKAAHNASRSAHKNDGATLNFNAGNKNAKKSSSDSSDSSDDAPTSGKGSSNSDSETIHFPGSDFGDIVINNQNSNVNGHRKSSHTSTGSKNSNGNAKSSMSQNGNTQSMDLDGDLLMEQGPNGQNMVFGKKNIKHALNNQEVDTDKKPSHIRKYDQKHHSGTPNNDAGATLKDIQRDINKAYAYKDGESHDKAAYNSAVKDLNNKTNGNANNILSAKNPQDAYNLVNTYK